MNREQFLANRRTCIGGSDVWEIVFGDPFKVWVDKCDPNATGLEDNDALRFGRRFERPILEEYAARHPEVTVIYEPGFFTHPKYPYIGGNLDAVGRNVHGDGHVLDAKNVDRSKEHQWDEESGLVPEHMALQMQHYSFLTGYSHGILVVCFGGNTYREFVVPYDAELYEGMILPRLAEFWKLVEAKTPPEPDFNAPHAVELQKRFHRRVRADLTPALPASKEILTLVAQREIAHRIMTSAEAAKDALTAQLLSILGEASLATVGDTGISLKRSEIAATWVPAYERKAHVKLDVKIPKAMKAELPKPDINALLAPKAEEEIAE